MTAIGDAIAPLGFCREGSARQFRHRATQWFVEFPPGPVAFGETRFRDDEVAVLATEHGPIRIVTPTQIVMDRVAAFVHWNDRQSFDEAFMVAKRQDMDWPALREWAEGEGVDTAIIDRLCRRATEVPDQAGPAAQPPQVAKRSLARLARPRTVSPAPS